jgi:hypothetical protein
MNSFNKFIFTHQFSLMRDAFIFIFFGFIYENQIAKIFDSKENFECKKIFLKFNE